ncbi:MAG: M20/M25/M40 family metallo-hydrolase [Candidatus Geothermarchaeales archaeon]
MTRISTILHSVDDHFDGHLDRIREFVRQPSISASGEGIQETAELCRTFVEGLGGEVRVVPTGGHPVVHGQVQEGADRTLLIYSMYDVQPVADEEGLWSVPPFRGQVTDLPEGKSLVARGVYNTKGPLRAFFNVCEEIKALEEAFPLNLVFVIEGEEELGSPHLPGFVETHFEELSEADAMYFPMPQESVPGRPNLLLGVKGIVYVDLEARGGAWGGPTEFGIHSSMASSVDSPLWRLVHFLSTLRDAEGRILLEGFYEDLRQPTSEEQEMAEEIAMTGYEEEWRRGMKIERFVEGATGKELISRYLFEPSLNIDGLTSGFTLEGTKTVLPHSATVKLDFRLLPDMSPEKVVGQLRRHIEEEGATDLLETTVHDKYPWSQSPTTSDVVKAKARALEGLGMKPLLWPRIAGSAPFYLFNRPPLDLPYVAGGAGKAGRAHSPNEYFTLEGIKRFEKGVASFLYHYAGIE